MKKPLLILFAVILVTGCQTLKESPKYKFNDGIYHIGTGSHKQRVYVENTEDSILVYALNKGWRKTEVDKSSLKKTSLPQSAAATTIQAKRYWQNSFDIDIVTIPFKFRPSHTSFPKQLSNQLNGALYLGYRNDTYRLSYDKNPIGRINQNITHFGFSAGIITGFGTTPMNPYVTENNITIEYDGLIWSKGVGIILGIDKVNFGIVAGLDHLLDENKTSWIYQGKPYVGLALGLNLN